MWAWLCLTGFLLCEQGGTDGELWKACVQFLNRGNGDLWGRSPHQSGRICDNDAQTSPRLISLKLQRGCAALAGVCFVGNSKGYVLIYPWMRTQPGGKSATLSFQYSQKDQQRKKEMQWHVLTFKLCLQVTHVTANDITLAREKSISITTLRLEKLSRNITGQQSLCSGMCLLILRTMMLGLYISFMENHPGCHSIFD